MDKRKILAIILFIFFSLFIFTFANPSGELEPVGNDGNNQGDINNDNDDDTNNDNSNDNDDDTNNNNSNNNNNNDNDDDNEVITPNLNISYEYDIEMFNNWFNKDVNVSINATEGSSLGIDNIKYCVTTDTTCTPTLDINNNEKVNIKNNGEKICALVIYSDSRVSSVTCSDVINIDTTKPTITIEDVSIKFNSEFDLLEGLITNDDLSGIDNNSITVSVDKIDTSSVGEIIVTYTVKDNAGNIATLDRKITVEPKEVLFTLTDDISVNDASWAKKNFNVYVNGVDENSTIQYCITKDETCTPSNDTKGTIKVRLQSSDTKVFVTVTNEHGVSKTLSTESYKLDKRSPIITGYDIYKGYEFEINTPLEEVTNVLLNGVTAEDNNQAGDNHISGLNLDGLVLNTNKLKLNKVGTYEVIYRATDNAGNKKTVTIMINVVNEKPSFTLSTDAVVNNNGWVNKDINVTIDGLSNTATYKTCVTTEDTCEPTDTNLVINTEGTNVKMCVIATDNNVQSDKICTDSFNLDKTKPLATEIVLDGELSYETITTTTCPSGYRLIGNKCYKGFSSVNPTVTEEKVYSEWYNSDVLISNTDASDNLSGVSGYTTNFTNNTVTVDGDNIIIELTVTDNASNETTITKTIKRDTTAPLIDLDIIAKEGVEGWYTYLDGNELSCITLPIVGEQCTSKFEVNSKDSSDALSGLKTVTINGTNIDLTNPQNVSVLTFSNITNYDVEVIAIDNAGNKAVFNTTVKFDATPPVINLNGLFNNEWSNKDFILENVSTTPIIGNFYDVESGIASYTTNPAIVTEEGITKILVTVTNKAGLTVTEEMEVKIDKTAPVINGASDIEVLVDSSFTIDDGITVTDNLSGVGIPLSIPGLQEIPGASELIKDLIGNKDYIAFVGDLNALTNITSLEDIKNLVTSIDTSKPGIYNVIYVAADNALNQTVITRKVTVKADAPTITINFNLKDTSKPLYFDNFTLSLGLEDSSDQQLENFSFCMPWEDSCQLNIELNSNYIDTLIEGYVPEDLTGLVPSLNSLYAVAEATNEDICITVYTGIVVSYNPVADAYNDALSAIKELEDAIKTKINEEITKINALRDQVLSEIETSIIKVELEIEELKTSLALANEATRKEIEAKILLLEQELVRINSIINSNINNISSVANTIKEDILKVQTEITESKNKVEEVIKNIKENIENIFDKVNNIIK